MVQRNLVQGCNELLYSTDVLVWSEPKKKKNLISAHNKVRFKWQSYQGLSGPNCHLESAVLEITNLGYSAPDKAIQVSNDKAIHTFSKWCSISAKVEAPPIQQNQIAIKTWIRFLYLCQLEYRFLCIFFYPAYNMSVLFVWFSDSCNVKNCHKPELYIEGHRDQ